MNLTNSRGPHRRRLALAGAVCACLLAPAGATAMTSPGDGSLSARLAELSRPAVGSLPPSEQADRLGLVEDGPGSLLRAGNRVLAEVRFDSGAEAGAEALRELGATVIETSRRYQAVTVAARPADLAEIGAAAGVAGVTEVLAPLVRGADCGGAVRSEGDGQMNVANARTSFGLDGSGVTVGILSDSFDRDLTAATHAAGDVASGDLPGAVSPCGSNVPVTVLDDAAGGEAAESGDEGRAMAQIVHDLAPGASLSFASAFTGELAFAANIKALANAGAKVITDDVTYFEEPFFQDGPVAVAVNEVSAAGVPYFTAVGNDNLIAKGRDIASWETAAFRDSGACPPDLAAVPLAGADHCLDFDPGAAVDDTFGVTVASGATLTVDLQWAEPWNGVATDIDVFLLDQAGKPITVEDDAEEIFVAGGDDNIAVTQRPFEVLQWENDTGSAQTVQLAINRFKGALPRLKFAFLQNGRGVTETEYPQSAGGDTVGPTVFGHAGAAGALSVGAVPQSNSAELERYSSRGPVTHYFGPVSGSGPAPTIVPQTLAKPDLVASDCVATTFFATFSASEGVWRFCGTSAAAPHAAAVAALLRQAEPAAGPAQVRTALTTTALPVGGFGANQVGAGLIDAFGAVAALAAPPLVTITQGPPPLGRNRRPTIQFTANRPVAFTCGVDGAVPQPCASPYALPNALRDGEHGIAVTGTDAAGRTGVSRVVMFTIDTRAPRTKIVKHPPKLIRTKRSKVRRVFRFRADEAGVVFVCKVDRDLARFCGQRISRRFKPGRHTLQVRARDAAGNVDRSPASFRFRVKRVG
jgi:hypothetical protein